MNALLGGQPQKEDKVMDYSGMIKAFPVCFEPWVEVSPRKASGTQHELQTK